MSRLRATPLFSARTLCILFLIAGSLFTLTTGCNSRRNMWLRDSSGTRWIRNGDEWKIRQVDPDDESILSAELKIEREESNGIASYRLERVELFPPGDPMPRLWRLLPPRSQLRSLDGTLLVHPDVAVLEELPEEPSLEEALAILPRFLHFDSRGEALARVARGRDGKNSFDELIEILESGASGPLGDPALDGISAPIGGSARRAAAPALDVLSTRTDFSRARYDRLAALADRFPSSTSGTNYLKRLIGKASTAAIARAAPTLPTTSARATVVEMLARQRDLPESDVVAICQASTSIGSASRQTAVLVELAPTGPIGPILDATSHIGSSSGRTEVLLVLARSRPLSAEDASAIARDSKMIGSTSGQTQVVESLVDVAPVADVIAAAAMIGSSSGRSTVLSSLARQPGLASEDAAAVAHATIQIGSSAGQTRVLGELVGTAPTTAIIAATAALPSSSGRGEVLGKLARRRDLTVIEANEIAAATPQIGSSSAQTEVLELLIGRATVATLIEAMTHIPSASGRGEVLLHLASESGLESAETTAIARAVAHLGSSPSTAGQVLRRLIGRVAVEDLIAATSKLGSENERFEVLVSIARAPGLAEADARRLADATRWLSTASHQGALIEALIGRAPVADLRSAASRVTSKWRREDLLERIDRSTRKAEVGE